MEMLSFKPVLAQDGLFLEEKFFGKRRVFKRKSCREDLMRVLFSFVGAGSHSSPG